MPSGVVPGVLVVDDDEGIRQTLRLVLEDAGYTITEAASGGAALDALRASADPLLVLLDYLMPGMDGGGVLRLIAADAPLAARHAYVLITASPQMLPPELVRLTKRLAITVLPKPFDMDVLLRTVEVAISTISARTAANRPPPA
ncbi:MAG: response regulator [Ktedonobacterales bacterium]|nr:response regulator [Ktedonobacterales bacterium]